MSSAWRLWKRLFSLDKRLLPPLAEHPWAALAVLVGVHLAALLPFALVAWVSKHPLHDHRFHTLNVSVEIALIILIALPIAISFGLSRSAPHRDIQVRYADFSAVARIGLGIANFFVMVGFIIALVMMFFVVTRGGLPSKSSAGNHRATVTPNAAARHLQKDAAEIPAPQGWRRINAGWASARTYAEIYQVPASYADTDLEAWLRRSVSQRNNPSTKDLFVEHCGRSQGSAAPFDCQAWNATPPQVPDTVIDVVLSPGTVTLSLTWIGQSG